MILASMLREEKYIDRYLEQVKELWDLVPDLRLLWVVDDMYSADGKRLTRAFIEQKYPVLKIWEHPTHSPKYPSVDTPDRWKAVSGVLNSILEHLPVETESDEVFVYVDADLRWSAKDLVDTAAELGPGVEMIGLSNRAEGADFYYDIWGTRGIDGVPVRADYRAEEGLTEMGSVGGCNVTTIGVAKQGRFGPAHIGWQTGIREKGYKVWITSRTAYHPWPR